MLFEFLFGSLFQPQKTLGTDNVFHLTGISAPERYHPPRPSASRNS